MSKPSKQRRSRLESFLVQLRGILDSLPSDTEKQEIESALLKMIGFLTDLKARLELVPSTQEVAGLRVAAQRLEQALMSAETDPVLAGVFGLARRTARRREGRAGTEASSAAGRAALEAIQTLPVEEILSRLNSDSYPLTTLRSVASVLGLRPTKGLSREALAHQIAMRIANARGYERLRGDAQSQE